MDIDVSNLFDDMFNSTTSYSPTFLQYPSLVSQVYHQHARELGRWLINDGYDFVPNSVQDASFEEAVKSMNTSPEPVVLVEISQEEMFTFTKAAQSGNSDESKLKVQIIVTSTTPMECILEFNSKLTFWASLCHELRLYNTAYSLYPYATFERRESLAISYDSKSSSKTRALGKYARRGWKIIALTPLIVSRVAGEISLPREFFPGVPRWVVDNKSWVVHLDTTGVVPPRALSPSSTALTWDPAAENSWIMMPYKDGVTLKTFYMSHQIAKTTILKSRYAVADDSYLGYLRDFFRVQGELEYFKLPPDEDRFKSDAWTCMADIVNGKCFAQEAPAEPPLIQHGNIVLQAHDIGWIITGCFTLLALIGSFWLINKHLLWYTNKVEQRYIVRILFMVPIYAVITFTSYLFWNHSIALLLIRDCYEAIVLTSFFYLILNYLSHDPLEQKDIFRKERLSRENDREARRQGRTPTRWVFPLQFIRWKPEDGLHFLQLMKWGVLQYCVVRPITTLAAVILNYIGLYCDDSWSPGWGHLYITVIMSISVTIAMYCLLQLYVPISGHLAPHKPLLKLFAVKAVVFLTFWQETFVSLLEDFGVIKDTQYMTADNIATGISAILETFEMTLFALLHMRAYTYKVYYTPPNCTVRWRSLLHAMNFNETFRELWTGTVYMIHRMRNRETDALSRREAVMEDVFGKSRIDMRNRVHPRSEKSPFHDQTPLPVEADEIVHIDVERQWLGIGDDYGYGLGEYSRSRKERSDPLEDQIERELLVRGHKRSQSRDHGAKYSYLHPDSPDNATPIHHRHPSWWQSMFPSNEEGHSHQDRPWRRSRTDPTLAHYTYDDPPPPSAIRTYRSSQKNLVADAVKVASVDLLPASRCTPLLSHQTQSILTDKRQERPLPAPPALSPTSLSPIDSTSDVTSRNSDSFLHRAFVGLPDSSSSAEVTISTPPSSQSHRTRVRLIGEPQILIQEISSARRPILIRSLAPTGTPVATASNRATLTTLPESPSQRHGRPAGDQHPVPPAPRTASSPRKSSHQRPHFRPRFTPSRDQIVLPTPLSSALNGRAQTNTSAPSAVEPRILPLDSSPAPAQPPQSHVLDLPLNVIFPPPSRSVSQDPSRHLHL
ncbi:uncharacterized protein FIBRA_01805 [Fibroporia radiculosa]|uniref:Uncharacterized protein n=1 Tax=Fibroporia radiculosa TaxID=599839 RepID=J4G169_9APHY|nr:uncharacterized protein FIBRA_01805 [Fibroporia radiculosa]CCL99783.1 predicted protein [Fibroporia radiculosa]